MTAQLDRTLAPEIQSIKKIKLLEARHHQLDNDIPLYSIKAGAQDIVKVEFLFNAGSLFQNKTLLAFATNALLDKGTGKHTSNEIADIIEFNGAYIELKAEFDLASVVIYSVNRQLKYVLPLIYEIFTESNFPQKEIALFRKRQLQKFNINQQKVDHVARKKFYEAIFGKESSYGVNPTKKDYVSIGQNELLQFKNRFYSSVNCKIIVSGKVTNSVIKMINEIFGNGKWNDQKIVNAKKITLNNPNKKKLYLARKGSKQSAIRIGKTLFNKTHKDFHELLILNTVLGGYFGSRLMSNIREDKGYTYGIGSGIVSMLQGGCFFIATEVGANVTIATLTEIYKEINLLRKEPIGEDELNLVKTYLQGTFLSGIDNPFALADKFKGLLKYGLSYDYYYSYLDKVKNITSERILELADKYLDPASLTEIVVGKK
ncbi:MAG: insulinase family protein [Bacteroidia bacterium]|nr:insulinase family protein [Bacteroidia bacterium]